MYDNWGTGNSGGSDGQQERDRQEFLILLVTLLPLQVIYPVLSGGPSERPVLVIFFSLLLVAGVWIMRGSRRRFLMAAIFTLVSLELLWISLWPAASSLILLGEFCLLLLLVILTGRILSTFIRTDLPVPDLLIAAVSLFLLTATVLGLGLFLVSGFSPAGTSSGSELALSLTNGISLITANGMMLTAPGQGLALSRVISALGMIGGILLITLVIGKIGSALRKKEAN
jgi:hypothetical protein